MSDLIRMTGLYSGMDTESVIQSLVSAKSQKVTDLKNEQKKLEWKQTAWQELNSKIYSFYSKTLSNMRYEGSYVKKTTSVSDTTKATIVSSDSAVNGTQTLAINSVAKSGYLTGAEVGKYTYEQKQKTITNKSKVSEINEDLVGKTISYKDGTSSFTISKETTIDELTTELQNKDINLSYNESTQKFSLGVSGNRHELNSEGTDILSSLGLFASDGSAIKVVGSATNVKGSTVGLYNEKHTTKLGLTSSSKLNALIGMSDTTGGNAKFKITVGTGSDAKSTEISIDDTTTISGFVSQLKSAGVNASFDETNQRFFISASSTGAASDFKIEAIAAEDKSSAGNLTDDELRTISSNALEALGLTTSSGAVKVDGEDAEIVLNNATFTSSSNTFNINGLTINVKGTTTAGDDLTITTDTDYDGIYDMIKDFISEYNEIINTIYEKYNADSARDYDMLTDDEKEEMTDDEIETWEDTIKASLLRKDTTLQSLMSTFVNSMSASYGKDSSTGNKLYLFSYGIETLGYFEAEENERYAYHIAGDPDDENTSTDDDMLKSAIANNTEDTVSFFTSLAKSLYDKLYESMKSTDYSSIYKVYEDKRLQDEYDDYTDKISDAEDELSDYEDMWYSRFSSMETALSKLQNTQSVVSSMLGTS
jgi:flagellar hook-associated protein 2